MICHRKVYGQIKHEENWKWLAYIFLRETIRSKDHHVQAKCYTSDGSFETQSRYHPKPESVVLVERTNAIQN